MPGLLDALEYVGGSLSKPGRAIRGPLTGNFREVMNVVPFSDTMGLTDPHDAVSGRNLSDKLGFTRPGDQGWGAWGVGMAADMATDPLTWLPGHAATKALGKTRLGEALASRTGKFMGEEAGALGLKYDQYFHPPLKMARNDPEWINNKTFYHGSGSPNLSGKSLDPMKTDIKNLYGRGVYTTESEDVGRSYFDKGLKSATQHKADFLHDNDFVNDVYRRGKTGEFDDFIRGHLISPEETGYGRYNFDQMSPNDRTLMLLDWARRGVKNEPSYAGWTRGSATNVDAYKLLAGDRAYTPSETLYQAQSNFGKVLDVDRNMPGGDYIDLFNAMEPSARNLIGDPMSLSELFRSKTAGQYRNAIPTGDPQSPHSLLKAMRYLNEYAGHKPDDFFLRGLRESGYDAMTHTGGILAGRGRSPHQVVIGLDPNDVLGLGRKTPYRQWEILK